MNIGVIIQARMGSTRLPGKIMKKIEQKTVLEYVISSLEKSEFIQEIIIATTKNKEDDVIEDKVKKLGKKIYRGSQDNVLERYTFAARENKLDIVIRITSDCPLIDVNIVDSIIKEFIDKKPDYISNTIKRTYPRGMDCEVFSINALERAYRDAESESDKEHVTPYIYKNPDKFKISNYCADEDNSKYRITLDVEEDFEVISFIIKEINNKMLDFSYESVIKIIEDSKIYTINQHVEQKKI